MTVNIAQVPHFVKANTPEMLQRKMRQLQAKDGVKYYFTNINRVDGQWFAWYEKTFKENKLKREEENGIS